MGSDADSYHLLGAMTLGKLFNLSGVQAFLPVKGYPNSFDTIQ